MSNKRKSNSDSNYIKDLKNQLLNNMETYNDDDKDNIYWQDDNNYNISNEEEANHRIEIITNNNEYDTLEAFEEGSLLSENNIDNDMTHEIYQDDHNIDDDEDIIMDSFSSSFNILDECYKIIEIKHNKKFPDDCHSIINIYSNITKQKFCDAYLSLTAKHGMNDFASNDIMLLFSQTCPEINFPIQQSSSGNSVCSAKKYVVANINNPVLTFHACPTCNDEVFAGPIKQYLLKCSLCGSNRFTFCTNWSCKLKNYEDCMHSLRYRVPRSVVYYKPLIPLFLYLVGSQEFIDAYKFKYIKPSYTSTAYEIMDVLDGKVGKQHLQEMENDNIPLRGKYDLFINLLLSLFHDGVQVYNQVFKNCWPLLTTILNLPPSFRTRLGAGEFMSSIFGGEEMGSYAERFTHQECYISELNELYKGIEFTGPNNQTIFLRAHLIQLLYDTKALEKEIELESVGSKAGCVLCKNAQPGTRRNLLNKTVYAGIRKFLASGHFLDTMGNSTQPHPSIFYTDTEENIFLYINNNKIECNECKYISKSSKFRCVEPRQLNYKTLDPVKYATQISDMEDDEKPYIWHHWDDSDRTRVDLNKFHFSHFKSELHFIHCHLNDKSDMELITQEEFKNRGIQADLTGKPCAGVKKKTAMSELTGFNLCQNVCFDPFHCLGGICLHYIHTLKGN